MDVYSEAKTVAHKIQECQKVLTAIGDENRQHLLIEMMQSKYASLYYSLLL